AQQRLARAFQEAVPAAWVTGESVYGDHRQLRAWLEERRQAYVVAVSGNASVSRASGQWPVHTLLAMVEEDDWRRVKAGDGTKGPRWDDWPWLALAAPERSDWRRWLVVRRSLSDPTERTAYIVYAPATTTLATVVPVIGRRWTIEVEQ
ncbi:MAG: IS701 family transposase, partial [Candidatus Tectimicrobiota bacterium]